jgi:nicotinamide-nucleotide amidase
VEQEKMHELAIRTGERLSKHGLSIATAESCTGGWIAKILTDIPGSSGWFERGFVTYSNEAKQDMLGVQGSSLQQHGAVSEQIVKEMARGALTNSRADVSVAVSGVAGPGGGTADKPVGTVWLAWAAGKNLRTLHVHLSGERSRVREQAVELALQGVLDIIG